MDKRILKQMFTDIAARDNYRPTLMGVHFEEDCCIATDTHMLVVYKQSNPELAGRTLTIDGSDCKGKYPDWRRVIPATVPNEPLPIDLGQLHKALKWHKRQATSHKEDKIAFGDISFSIDYLCRVLNVYKTAQELSECRFTLNVEGRPAKMESTSLTSILMPVLSEASNVDGERLPETALTLSYETIINNYAFNSWKKAEKPAELAWVC